MRVEIKANWQMIITAENETESIALESWSEKYLDPEKNRKLPEGKIAFLSFELFTERLAAEGRL